MHISMILAEKILTLLEESGAAEIEKLAALDIARSVVPVSPGSVYIKSEAGLPSEDSPGSAP